jgi:hypothetical protein
MWFDGVSVQQSAAQTSANTNTTTTGISTSLPRLLGRISLRIASRREAEIHGQAERIVSQRTKQKIELAFDSVVRNRTAEFTQLLRDQYAKLPLEGRFAFMDIRCSTTSDTLQIVVLGSGDKLPMFVSAPAQLPEHPDIEIHIHTALLRKAVLDADLRNALQASIGSIIDQPLSGLSTPTPAKSLRQPERGPEFQWSAGSNSDWLSIYWNAKGNTEMKDVRKISALR